MRVCIPWAVHTDNRSRLVAGFPHNPTRHNMGVYLVESWWLNGMVPSLVQTAGSSKANLPPWKTTSHTLEPSRPRIHFRRRIYVSNFSFYRPFLDPGAAMPRDLPCPSRNLTGPGSPEAPSENITLSDERWRKMKAFVDIDGTIYARISPAALRWCIKFGYVEQIKR